MSPIIDAKLCSDNIRATAGIVPIRGLNVFGNESFTTVLEKLHTVITTVPEGYSDDNFDGTLEENCGLFSISALSAPLFQFGEDVITLVSQFFIWKGLVFSKGATFGITEDDEVQVLTPELVEPASVISGQFSLLCYDTYNGSSLVDIEQKVLDELDLELDREALPKENDDERWTDDPLSMVKYISVYTDAPIPSTGRVFIIEDTLDDAITKFSNQLYDAFLVELINKTQPFAYIAVEGWGEPLMSKGDFEEKWEVMKDYYGDTFSSARSDINDFAVHLGAPIEKVFNTTAELYRRNAESLK